MQGIVKELYVAIDPGSIPQIVNITGRRLFHVTKYSDGSYRLDPAEVKMCTNSDVSDSMKNSVSEDAIDAEEIDVSEKEVEKEPEKKNTMGGREKMVRAYWMLTHEGKTPEEVGSALGLTPGTAQQYSSLGKKVVSEYTDSLEPDCSADDVVSAIQKLTED